MSKAKFTIASVIEDAKRRQMEEMAKTAQASEEGEREALVSDIDFDELEKTAEDLEKIAADIPGPEVGQVPTEGLKREEGTQKQNNAGEEKPPPVRSEEAGKLNNDDAEKEQLVQDAANAPKHAGLSLYETALAKLAATTRGDIEKYISGDGPSPLSGEKGFFESLGDAVRSGPAKLRYARTGAQGNRRSAIRRGDSPSYRGAAARGDRMMQKRRATSFMRSRTGERTRDYARRGGRVLSHSAASRYDNARRGGRGMTSAQARRYDHHMASRRKSAAGEDTAVLEALARVQELDQIKQAELARLAKVAASEPASDGVTQGNTVNNVQDMGGTQHTVGNQAGGSSKVTATMDGQTEKVQNNAASLKQGDDHVDQVAGAHAFLQHTPEKEGDEGPNAKIESLIGEVAGKKTAQQKRDELAELLMDPEKAASVREALGLVNDQEKVASVISQQELAALQQIIAPHTED
jgi:hypothetical protein